MASYLLILPALSAALCVGLGLFTLRKNPRHTSNIGFTAGLACLALTEAGSALALMPGAGLALTGMTGVMLGQALLPAAWLVFTSVFGRGNYRDLSANQLYLTLGTAAISVIFCALLISTPDSFVSVGSVFTEDPLFFTLGPAGKYLYIFFIIGMVLNLVQLENTLRASKGSTRWNVKYLVFGVGSILAFFIYLATQSLLFSAIDAQLLLLKSAVIIISVLMMTVFIVKHRLLDVDIFVSRYFVYNSVTVLAVGIYLLAVGLITHGIKFFNLPYGGFFSTLFIFISVLFLIILLFAAALRRKAQLFINRHFYKHKYEFRDKWMETVEKITPRRSVREVSDTLIDIISETMFPSAIHLWVFDPASKCFAHAGRGPAPSGLENLQPGNPFAAMVSECLSPFTVDEARDIGGRQIFLDTGTILCAPLVAGRDINGFLLLGPDRSGARYIQDDNELLKAVTTQAAVQIKEIMLLEELTASREMEAFSKMSSFIMHDLKNLTNSLSLISQNAQHNMDNPEFQRDTIKTIDGTVSRMKKVIERLSNLPSGLELKKTVLDIGELAEKSLMKISFPAEKEITLKRTIGPCPPVLVDPEAFEMVILNLLLNAYEAIPVSGEISLSAYHDSESVNLCVADTGRGMTTEYIRTSLFKPFKSTKKNGLGIGLFQCKNIIEGMGGSISVESSPETGTKFTVKLPFARLQ
jgi:putative PEP-CTERM system histidine kinase